MDDDRPIRVPPPLKEEARRLACERFAEAIRQHNDPEAKAAKRAEVLEQVRAFIEARKHPELGPPNVDDEDKKKKGSGGHAGRSREPDYSFDLDEFGKKKRTRGRGGPSL